MARNRPTILYGTYTYDERVHRGILRFGRQHGWKVRLLLPHSWQHAEMLVADGIISMVEPEDDAGSGMTEHLMARGLPMVDLSLNHPEVRALRLLPDARGGGRMAAEYLAGFRFERWLHVCWGRTWHDELRIAGFREGAESAGMPWELLEIRDHKDDRMAVIRRRLLELPKPLGVFCSFDHYSEQVLEVCLEAGLAVPQDVAILGCYNHEVHSVFSEIPLSSIDMGLEDRGYQAASLLQGLLDGGPVPDEPLYSPAKGVIERASTNLESSRDPVVAQALYFIESRMHQPLGVEEVAAAVGVSRASLQRRFEKACGRGVGKEILRIKMDRAAKLLREEDDSAAMVAGRVGFPDALHFYRVFKKYTGLTTKEYRARHRVIGQ
ncbi:substrate-binding domain-containing protein [Luteolibacter ambystomatis]|uniref:Substrate-binding domain-containing protein n=1 Tax=Luteolibacter ambystomatis TaxID=2824561 RepID=A0A975J0W0_9BACT|nr:substrate-binding domain-containing protein [Luteolibacter ambystomatis]QUE51975.1 substrate-binding domain-containing protein [Luteolibacter ambystomatis]